jgi:sugar lactone lactonase YvrE
MRIQLLGLAITAVVSTTACGSRSHGGELPDAAVDPPGPDAPVCTAPAAICGDSCVDVLTDVLNCGACGHACGCGSTSCTNGVCDSHALATQQGAPMVLALHDDKLYWGNDADRTVSTVPVAGGAASVLYPGRTVVRGFAFDATRVYFTRTNFNIVESGALDGSSSGNFTNAREPGGIGIATDATAVYWTTYDGGTTGLIRTAGLGARGTGTTLIGGQVSPDGLALDATNVYWTTHTATGTVMQMPKAGGAAVALADTQANPHSIAVAGGFVYWTNQGNGTVNTGSVQRVAVTGGTITTLADKLPFPVTLVVDASYVYWTDTAAGAVMRVPIAGGPAAPVAIGEQSPNGLAISSACAYFTDHADGNVGTGSIRSHDLD